jgi:2-amino-4-hydroxy-6-hydroxymethyldihydropteridine diphosphokinase
MTTVFIALGSNLGDRPQNLREAMRRLSESAATVRKVSRLYETEPVDYLDQPWFLNAVLEAETSLPAEELLGTLRSIEAQMGSKKAFAKGPRLIDLDILLYNNASIETPTLQIPHPRMLHRNFVMVPLAEIAPSLRHSSWQGNAAELAKQTGDHSQIRLFEERT